MVDFVFFSSKKGDGDFSYAKCTVTWVSRRFTSLLLAARTSAVVIVYKNVTMTTLTHNLLLFFLLEDFKYCSYSATCIYACLLICDLIKLLRIPCWSPFTFTHACC